MGESEKAARFRALHESGTFVMPNAWDAGSARLLEAVGFPAIATTSSAFAASLGRDDQTVTREELVRHVASLTEAVSIPVSVDAECCYPDEPGGVAHTVGLLAEAGAAGLSIEDYDPGAGRVLSMDDAVAAVSEVVEAARAFGLVVTARAENHLYGVDDLDDTVARLVAYRDAGADVVYAPGPTDGEQIARIVCETGAPVNVLARPGVPPVHDLARIGVRRISTGGALAWTAYGALVDSARALLDTGEYVHLDHGLDSEVQSRAFG